VSKERGVPVYVVKVDYAARGVCSNCANTHNTKGYYNENYNTIETEGISYEIET